VFDRPTREFYDLEHLWADAKRVRWRKPVRRAPKRGRKS
jgi:ribosomal silencing factor RsfS